jgi:hypothetical protein
VTQSQQPPLPQKPPLPGRASRSRSDRTEKLLIAILDPIDIIGQKLMGDLWRTFYLSVQDAIALACILQIPSFIGKVIIGKEFNSFTVCLTQDAWGPNRYACFVMLIGEFSLWAVLAARVLARFIQDFISLLSQRGKPHAKQP